MDYQADTKPPLQPETREKRGEVVRRGEKHGEKSRGGKEKNTERRGEAWRAEHG